MQVRVSSEDRGIRIKINNDGAGFDPGIENEGAPGHMGLVTIRERAELAGGWFRLTTEPGKGTSVLRRDWQCPVSRHKRGSSSSSQ